MIAAYFEAGLSFHYILSRKHNQACQSYHDIDVIWESVRLKLPVAGGVYLKNGHVKY